MNDHVGKPFDLTQLVTVINNLLRKDSTHEAETEIHDRVAHYSESADLDVQEALRRFGGNKSVYGNALLNFGRDASMFLLQLTDLVRINEETAQVNDDATRSDQQEKLRQILHAFKGLAGTIGAMTLHRVVANAENSSIQSFKNEWLEFRRLVEQTIEQTQLVAQEMNSKLFASQLSASSEQIQPILSDLESLMRLLSDSNMQAMSIYEQLKSKYAAYYPDQFHALAQAMNQLDFPAALSCCEDLKALWGDQ